MKHPWSFILITILSWNVSAAEPAVSEQDLPHIDPTAPGNAVNTFELDPAFRLELVAAEPLVSDPVALSFDANGHLYVVEMRGYSERREDRLGRIRRLSDVDGDGDMDQATSFADGLSWPTGVLCYDGGLFVLAAPDLFYFKDTDGDGVADEKSVVLTGFSSMASRLNVQQLPNSLRWGIDQRIHIAEGGNGSIVHRPDEEPSAGLRVRGYDLSFNPKTMHLRLETGGGQYGMAFDDAGRKFVSSNSRHLMQVVYDARAAAIPGFDWPAPNVDIAADGAAAPVYRLSPDEPWRVIRTRWRVAGMVGGPIEGGGTPSGYFTGATGVQIYRGDLFPKSYRGNAFIADCGSNLVHRKRLVPDGIQYLGERMPEGSRREFLASTDNWFRPVQLENGPDGALYILDLYREIIEHPWSLPPGIKQHLDLNRGNDRGRIWRVVPVEATPRRSVKLLDLSNEALVGLLDHPNGWHRDTAGRLLFERDDSSIVNALERQALESQTPVGVLHAIHLLNAKSSLKPELLSRLMAHPSSEVCRSVLKLSLDTLSDSEWRSDDWRQRLRPLAVDRDLEVRFELAIVLAQRPVPGLFPIWKQLLETGVDDPWVERSMDLLAKPHAEDWLPELLDEPPGFWRAHATLLGALAGEAALDWSDNRLLDELRQLFDQPSSDRSLLLAGNWARGLSGISREELRSQSGELLAAWLPDLASVPEAAWRRQSYLQLASLLPSSRAAGLLRPVLVDAGWNSEDRQLALEAMISLGERAVIAELIQLLPELSPSLREILLQRALHDADLLDPLLVGAGENEDIRASLGIPFRQRLREHDNPEIRSRSNRLFGEANKTSINDRIAKFEPALDSAGNVDRGREIFLARCATCHEADDIGQPLGPDLLTVAAAGRVSLLNNIIDPNREVASQYESWRFLTDNNEEYTGILAGESADTFRLRMAGGLEQRLERSQLHSFNPTGQSLMPEGLEEGMSVDDMASLLRFIESLAQP